MNILHALPPEPAHRLALAALARGLVPPQPASADAGLSTVLFGRPIPNPIGIAAGFDKNGEAFTRMPAQGFGFVEIGGVTPRAQAGNPRPRLFRLPADRAIINRAGLPSDGMERVAERVAAARRRAIAPALLGVNLASNTASADPAADFVALVRRFAPLADFLTLNLSCPNVANGCLFQRREPLDDLLQRLRAALAGNAAPRPALVAKLSPDLDEPTLEAMLDALAAFGIDGIIVSNTSAGRPDGLRADPRVIAERGGLSGPPLFARSTALLARVHELTGGRIPLIGVGGVSSGRDAYRKIRAGASAVQLYTGLIYDGPALVTRIKRELAACLRADGFTSVAEAVGVAPVPAGR